jgi:hypothetical protein
MEWQQTWIINSPRIAFVLDKQKETKDHRIKDVAVVVYQRKMTLKPLIKWIANNLFEWILISKKKIPPLTLWRDEILLPSSTLEVVFCFQTLRSKR